jgi:hypothetical protein
VIAEERRVGEEGACTRLDRLEPELLEEPPQVPQAAVVHALQNPRDPLVPTGPLAQRDLQP